VAPVRVLPTQHCDDPQTVLLLLVLQTAHPEVLVATVEALQTMDQVWVQTVVVLTLTFQLRPQVVVGTQTLEMVLVPAEVSFLVTLPQA
jgi:hypothetical protein